MTQVQQQLVGLYSAETSEDSCQICSIQIACLSVRPSVRPSVSLFFCVRVHLVVALRHAELEIATRSLKVCLRKEAKGFRNDAPHAFIYLCCQVRLPQQRSVLLTMRMYV